MSDSNRTHFGYQDVDWSEKAGRVRQVFDSVAPKYDLMNDLMSGGLHRIWKRIAVDLANVRPGQQVLDLASGSGDLAKQFSRRVGKQGQVFVTDINAAMLEQGRINLLDAGMTANCQFVQVNAEQLPFADNSLDCISIGFGLRNVTDKARALSAMCKALKPGGRVIVLEFSKPANPFLSKLYDSYSFSLLPMMGKLVANDEDSYRYLAESIRMHPAQEELSGIMQEAGLEGVEYFNLAGGIVAVHRGYRF